MSGTITLKEVFAFFMPLILTTELTQISHSIISAVLARQEQPKIALAAFAVAAALQQSIGSPQWCASQVAISFISDKRSLWRLTGFFGLVSIIPAAVLLAIALTPAGEYYIGVMLGASEAVVRQARWGTLVMTSTLIFVLLRSLSFGLIMVKRRTVLLTYATVVRLGALALLLAVLPHFMPAAVAGAAALSGCIAAEGLFAAYIARHFYAALPDRHGEALTLGEVWRFSWPLMLANVAENSVAFIINLFLGRLAKPDLALAAFGVVNGLVRVLLAPLRNLAQTAQTMVRTREDVRVMLRFTFRAALFFAVLVIGLFQSPLRRVILEDVMGLRAELRAYAEPAVLLIFLGAVVLAYGAVFRGLLSAARRTKPIAVSSAVRLVAIVAVSGVTLLVPGSNGAVVGVLAIVSAYYCETAVLGWQVLPRRAGAATENLFPSATFPSATARPTPRA